MGPKYSCCGLWGPSIHAVNYKWTFPDQEKLTDAELKPERLDNVNTRLLKSDEGCQPLMRARSVDSHQTNTGCTECLKIKKK